MALSDELVDEFKQIYKDEKGVELSDQEARDMGERLVGYVKLVFDISLKDQKRKRRLKTEPKGFPVDGHYSCIVCHQPINEETGWYDHNGQKCLSCQKATEEGVLPGFVCHHRDSFFLMWELNSNFNIKSPTARKYVREGRLVARVTPAGEHVFLKKENLGLIERHSAEWKSYQRHRSKMEKIRRYKHTESQ